MDDVEGGPVSDADIAGMTTWSLVRLGRHVERLLADALQGSGLTPLQYGVLAQLSADPSLTQAALARAVLLRPQSMQHQLDQLSALGLVERGPGGRGRRRAVRLTERGRTRLGEVQVVIDRANSAAALRMSTDDLAALRDTAMRLLALDRLRRILGHCALQSALIG